MYVCIHVTVYAIYHVSVPSNPKILSLRISLAKSPGDKTWLSDIWNCTQIILLLNPMSLVRDLRTLAASNAML